MSALNPHTIRRTGAAAVLLALAYVALADRVHFWDFDEADSGAATADDSEGVNTDGVFQGTATRVPGLVGVGGARFSDVANDAVNVGTNGYSFTSGITIEALIKPEWQPVSSTYDQIFRKEDSNDRILLAFQSDSHGSSAQIYVSTPSLSFGLNTGGYGELEVPLDRPLPALNGGNPDSGTIFLEPPGTALGPNDVVLKDGNVHHVAATYDQASGEKAIWIDGVKRWSFVVFGSPPIVSGGAGVAFIGSADGTQEPFRGVIDEVALHDCAITAGDIAAHYASALAGQPYGPSTCETADPDPDPDPDPAPPAFTFELSSGKGAALLGWDDEGALSGLVVHRGIGLVRVAGTVTEGADGSAQGAYELRDPETDELVGSGALTGKTRRGNLRLRLRGDAALKLRGGPRPTTPPAVPTGLFEGVVKGGETGKYRHQMQIIPTGDPQVLLLQGDNDIDFALGQAMGGALMVTRTGKVFGISQPDADPDAAPRFLKGKYAAATGKLKLVQSETLAGGARRKVKSTADASNGRYDGLYLLPIRPLGCGLTAVAITVVGGVVSGTDPSTGTIAGSVNERGDISFTTDKLLVSGTCAHEGERVGPFNFTGQVPAWPWFPLVLSGTFEGPGGTSGDFSVEIPIGPTGATAGSAVPPRTSGRVIDAVEDLPKGKYRVRTVISVTGFGVVEDTTETFNNTTGKKIAKATADAMDAVIAQLDSGACSASRSSSPWDGTTISLTLRATCTSPERSATAIATVTVTKL